jgi:hypothetical protein
LDPTEEGIYLMTETESIFLNALSKKTKFWTMGPHKDESTEKQRKEYPLFIRTRVHETMWSYKRRP